MSCVSVGSMSVCLYHHHHQERIHPHISDDLPWLTPTAPFLGKRSALYCAFFQLSSSCIAFLFFQDMPANEVDELEQATMVVFFTGKEEPFHPPKYIKNSQRNRGPEWVALVCNSYCHVLRAHIHTQPKNWEKLKYTCELVQKVLMELEGKKMSQKFID